MAEERDEDISARFEQTRQRYLAMPRELSQFRNWVYDVFDSDNVHPEGARSEGDLKLAFQNSVLELVQLNYQLASRGLIDHAQQEELRRCMKILHRAHAIVLHEYRLRETAESEDSAPHLDMIVDNYSTQTETTQGLNDLQKLEIFLLKRCRDENLRKHADMLYHEIVTDAGHYTRAWEPYMTITEFIHESCDRDAHNEQWKWMTSSAGNVASCMAFLRDCRDRYLPVLQRNRYFISFRNGIYSIPTDEFFDYETSALDPTITSINYIDRYFDPALCEKDEDGMVMDPEDIKIPGLDKIVETQRLEPEVIEWLWIMMGRLLYNNCELDNWQRIPFIKGVAGSGKSSMAHLFELIYGEMLGVISSTIEPQFGLEGLVDKLMWICYEVKDNFRLDQGQLQSMSSRDPVVVARKHKTALVIRKWIACGLLLGNEWAKRWADAAGALARRLLIFFFNFKPTDIDPHLYDKLNDDLARIVVKFNRHYIQAVIRLNGEPLEKHLPEYFFETQRKLEVQTNPLLAFLIYSDTLEVNPEKYISVGDFQHHYARYCRDNNLPIQRISDEHKSKRPLEQLNIAREVRRLKYGPRRELQEMEYFIGIGLRDDPDAPLPNLITPKNVKSGAAPAPAPAAGDIVEPPSRYPTRSAGRRGAHPSSKRRHPVGGIPTE